MTLDVVAAEAGSAAVLAVIVDQGARALAIQLRGDERWLLPGGPLARGEAVVQGLRQRVRTATGFELKDLTPVDRYAVGPAAPLVYRCAIRGVGADITANTRAMRWMTADIVEAEMDPSHAAAALIALDLHRAAVAATPAPPSELLAG